MRRSFQLATAFTGAAALAGGFGPTALAATGQAVRPDYTAVECLANNGGLSEYVHLYYPNDDHPAMCIGGTGKHSVTATIASFCPGNNHGDAWGSVPYNPHDNWVFYPGSGRHKVGSWDGGWTSPYVFSFIQILSWAGHSKCG